MVTPTKILFVCLGNICRSPTAHGIFEKLVKDAGLQESIHIDSAGTASWHSGNLPDKRSMEHALKRGYDLSTQRSRRVTDADFHEYDLIMAMDMSNYNDLIEFSTPDTKHKIKLFLKEYGTGKHEVPDPYYKGEEGFEEVLDLLEEACGKLLEKIKPTK